jgi:cellulose synthase/poly-beta-1,6-N-acetylglucosamine synthase-like glycosyltransferase
VQNLQVAVRATRKRSQILAFADSDGRVTRRWLRALAAPLGEPGVGAATGYRWFIPVPPAFWALMRGVWDAVVAGTLGPGDNRFAWGGAMAIRKETFLEARVAEYWKNTLSDDYAHQRRTVFLLDAPPVGDHTRVQPAPVVARPQRACFLLRGHGGVGDRLGHRLPLG